MDTEIRGVFVIRIHHNMALALSTQNVTVTAFNFENGCVVLTPENIKSDLKLLPRLVHNRSILREFRDILSLSKSITAARPEVVHVNALQDLFSAFIAVRICALHGLRPAIITMSRNSLSWGNPRKDWLFAKLLEYLSDGVIALATTHQNQLLRFGIPSRKVAVIPNPFDPSFNNDFSQHDREASNGNRRIIYVANICENKAQDILIRAAASVLERHPGTEFELVGRVTASEEAYSGKLKTLTKELGIERSVHFVGEVPYDEVLTLLQESDFFVFPTRAEMMPRALIEAMVIGKPVIASAVDGILDLVENRKTGILVEPGNVKELADAICEFIENPCLAISLGSAGKRYVLEYCSPERVGRQFCDFYKLIRSQSQVDHIFKLAQ